MKTLIPGRTVLDLSSPSAISRLFIAGSLLALAACGGAGTDGAALEPGDHVLGADEVGTPSPEAIGTQQQPLWGNDCRNADIRVVNSLDYTIKVKSVDYYNVSEGRWQTELLNNQDVTPGAMGFWMPDLNGSENDVISSFNVNYECHGAHDHSYHVNTPDVTCIPGRVFLLEVP
jgi:hypothetical protein